MASLGGWTKEGQICLIICFSTVFLFDPSVAYCQEGLNCRECQLYTLGHHCSSTLKKEYFYCDKKTDKVLLDPRAFLECKNKVYQLGQCEPFSRFHVHTQGCTQKHKLSQEHDEEDNYPAGKKLFKRSSGSKTGDMCAFNTDCQSGMYCFNGVCTCLSNYVSISGYCWPKVNPGDSGCVEDLQCEAVWPGSKCSRMGLCECPEHTLPSKTRDGTVCITAGVPPACPLPEPNNPEAPNPATILANPTSHPLAQDT